MRSRWMGILLILPVALLIACNTSTNKEAADTPQQGTIHISVEQSFRPVIDAQIKMYEATYPNTHIKVHYKAESECLRDFFNDTGTRMVIISRPLTAEQDRAMKAKIGYIPGCQQIASDAVAIVLHPKQKDSLFTLSELRADLSGKGNRDKIFVFDGSHATGTVSYIRDSILKGSPFDNDLVKATQNAEEVIRYVSTHENAIGFVGVSEIGNPEDSNQVLLSNMIKYGFVRCDICQDTPYVMPLQQSMASRRYPLTRGIYYAIKENYTGLGSGFTSFLKFEKGQLIFRRAYLNPVMDLNNRPVEIRQ